MQKFKGALKCLIFSLVLSMVVAGCGGGAGLSDDKTEDRNYGVETSTPQPLENAFLLLTTKTGENYRLTTDKDGNGSIAKVDEDGNLIEKVDVSVTVDENGVFEVSATFPNGRTITIRGAVDAAGNILNGSVNLNNVNVVVVIVVVNVDPSGGSSIYYSLRVAGQDIIVHNMGRCGNYVTRTNGAAGFTQDVTCSGETHKLIFSNIVYENGAVISFNTVIDGVSYSYSGGGTDGGADGGNTDGSTDEGTGGSGDDGVEEGGTPPSVSVEGPILIADSIELVGVAWDGANLWALDSRYDDSECVHFKVDPATGATIGSPIHSSFWPGTPNCQCKYLEWDGSNFWSVQTGDVPRSLAKISADGTRGAEFNVASSGFPDGMNYHEGVFATIDNYPETLFLQNSTGSLLSQGVVWNIAGSPAALTWCAGSYWIIDSFGAMARINDAHNDIDLRLDPAEEIWPFVADASCDEAGKIIWVAVSPMGDWQRLFKIQLP